MKNLFTSLFYRINATTKPSSFMTVTSTAVHRLKEIMQQRNSEKIVGVKISLTKKGCSGLSYDMKYLKNEEIKKFDEVVDEDGIKIVIDSKAVIAIIGTQMDFVESQLGRQFVFNNPNQKGKCGCGESFHI